MTMSALTVVVLPFWSRTWCHECLSPVTRTVCAQTSLTASGLNFSSFCSCKSRLVPRLVAFDLSSVEGEDFEWTVYQLEVGDADAAWFQQIPTDWFEQPMPEDGSARACREL